MIPDTLIEAAQRDACKTVTIITRNKHPSNKKDLTRVKPSTS